MPNHITKIRSNQQRPNKLSSKSARQSLSCESLERRELFAGHTFEVFNSATPYQPHGPLTHLAPVPCDVSLDDGHLVIEGTTLNDSVIIDEVEGTFWRGHKTTFVKVQHTCGGAANETRFLAWLVDDIEFNGKAGNDYFLNNTALKSTAVGGSGSDILVGGSASDTLYGDSVQKNTRLVGGHGIDQILGRGGNDLLHGGGNADVIYGGEGDDWIYGDSGDDWLLGQEGDDFIFGNSGADRIYGHEGHDALFGEVGDDMLFGGDDDDNIYGQEGNDTLVGEDGRDRLFGGDGDDDLDGGQDDSFNDILTGGKGADLFHNNPCSNQDNPTDLTDEDLTYGCLGTPIGNPVDEN